MNPLLLSLVLLPLVFLPAPAVVTLYVVLGQGHFFSAYAHKVVRGRVGAARLARWALGAVLLFGGYELHPAFVTLQVVTIALFMLHFVLDENYLAGRPPSLNAWLEALAVALMFAALQTDQSVGTAYFKAALWFAIFAFQLSLVLVRGAALQSAWWRLCAGLVALWVWQMPISFTYVIGAIIIYHYMHWYGIFYLRSTSRLPYVALIGAANLVAVVLYAAGVGGLFSLDMFYLWTLLHVLTSVRPADVAVARERSTPARTAE